MLFNDISNRQAPVICFHADLLFSDKNNEKTFSEKIKELFVAPSEEDIYLKRELNTTVLRTINNIWYNYEYSIYIATDKNYTKNLEDLFSQNNLCYTRLYKYSDLFDLERNADSIFWLYVDNNEERLSRVNNKYAITFDKLPNYLNINRMGGTK